MQTYDRLGVGYRTRRRPDARIAAQLREALGEPESVLNVGAGAGSYEPSDLQVVAVEPSRTMIAQRPEGAAPCVQAEAEALPFADGSFDAVMGVLTVHHWAHLADGLSEVRRVARRRVVVLSWDPVFDEQFWLTREYLPEILAVDRARYPKLEKLLGATRVEPLMVPADCTDGFRSAYWKRPEAYLDAEARRSISHSRCSMPRQWSILCRRWRPTWRRASGRGAMPSWRNARCSTRDTAS